MLDDLKPHEGNILTTDIVYGMYILTHVKSKKRYVGSSSKIGTRLSGHWSMLSKGKHFDRGFQAAYNTDPEINTVFYVTSDRESAYDLEQAYLDKYFDTGELFNQTRFARAPGKGRVITQEERDRVGKQNRGKEFSPQWRAKIGDGNRGKVRTPEQRLASSVAKKGIPLNPEARAKIDKLNGSKMKRLMGDGVAYKGLMKAACALGVHKDNIRNRIRSHLPQWAGWHYIEEEVT